MPTPLRSVPKSQFLFCCNASQSKETEPRYYVASANRYDQHVGFATVIEEPRHSSVELSIHSPHTFSQAEMFHCFEDVGPVSLLLDVLSVVLSHIRALGQRVHCDHTQSFAACRLHLQQWRTLL